VCKLKKADATTPEETRGSTGKKGRRGRENRTTTSDDIEGPFSGLVKEKREKSGG